MRILIVCLGNICRSPIAEGVLRHKAKQQGLDWTVESAGTEAYHIGKAPHQHSQKVCLSRGIDISGQRARRFSARDFKRYDKIYAMATDVLDEIRRIGGSNADMSKVDLFLNELEDNCNASVPDPWYGDESDYLPVYELIERTCDAIVARYGKR
jgi:protein-tyrosine phosphatase